MAATVSLTAPFTVLDVVDTRAVEEVDDNVWKPIPGSGVENECARCTRLHEVHAHVRDANGIEATVGTGCMNADSELKKTLRSLTGKATRTNVTAAKERAAEVARQTLADLRALIPAFPADRVEFTHDTDTGSRGTYRWSVDGVTVSGFPHAGLDGAMEPPDDETHTERLSSLSDAWASRHLARLAEAQGLELYRLRARAGEFG